MKRGLKEVDPQTGQRAGGIHKRTLVAINRSGGVGYRCEYDRFSFRIFGKELHSNSSFLLTIRRPIPYSQIKEANK